jgi:FHS family L-fucose permease-like MFS transporter
VLALIAVFFWGRRAMLAGQRAPQVHLAQITRLLLRPPPRLAFGALCIFLYVGAEVSIASLMINYLGEARTLALDPRAAAVLLSDYWLGALVGRMLGGFLLRLGRPGWWLAAFAGAAIALVTLSANSAGALAAWSLIAVGLANSIMFPTIFSLAVDGLGDQTPQASGLLCTAIVGGAVIPPTTGLLADHFGLAVALLLPAALYLWIATYGVISSRRGVAEAAV